MSIPYSFTHAMRHVTISILSPLFVDRFELFTVCHLEIDKKTIFDDAGVKMPGLGEGF